MSIFPENISLALLKSNENNVTITKKGKAILKTLTQNSFCFNLLNILIYFLTFRYYGDDRDLF